MLDYLIIFLIQRFFIKDNLRRGYKFSGEIISSSKSLLEDIRNLYRIKNRLGFKDKNQKTYRLAIGADLYREMMLVYSNSMQRKRPDYRLAIFEL